MPRDVWRSERGGVLLVSNYPDCILENEGWCVLCAGFVAAVLVVQCVILFLGGEGT